LTRAIHGARPSGAGRVRSGWDCSASRCLREASALASSGPPSANTASGVQPESTGLRLSNPSGFVHTTAHRTNRKGDPSGSPFLFVGGGASLGETRLTRIFPVRRESTGKLARCARARTDLIPGTAGTSGPFAVRCLAANFASRELTGNSPALFGAAPHPCSPDPTRASSSIT
jgi:hypothetical protein